MDLISEKKSGIPFAGYHTKSRQNEAYRKRPEFFKGAEGK